MGPMRGLLAAAGVAFTFPGIAIAQTPAYPPAGSTETEILYNQQKPFQWAWIFFLGALVVIAVSGMLKSTKIVYASGLLITLAAIAYSAWGFALRVR